MIAGAVAAIFMYHHVSSDVAPGPYARALTVSPAEFSAQLQSLADRGCVGVALSRLVDDVRGASVRGCEVALTFDDGYEDAATVALPLLQRFGDVGTFFVTTGFVDTPGHLTRAQIRTLVAAGMEIGAHTVSHVDLTLVSLAAARAQVDGSRAALQQMTGQSVDGFAYPSGKSSAAVEAVVRDDGFAYAVTTRGYALTATAIERDPFALPRYRVVHGKGAQLFAIALRGAVARAPAVSPAAVRSVARERIAGNAPDAAERVAVALLDGDFPEQVLKVRVLAEGQALVAGVMLSGVKFHEPVGRAQFAADVTQMIGRAFAADPAVTEVDVWTVVPIAVPSGVPVSGDLAAPTTRTVFSASLLRPQWTNDPGSLGKTYWEPGWPGE